MGLTFKLHTVRLGDAGSSVLLVQEILRARGFVGADGKPLKLDGKAGENTIYAVVSYIEDRKVHGVDLGEPNVWGKLCWADQNWETA